MTPTPEVLRQERQTRRAEANERIIKQALWLLALLIFMALLIAAFAPAIAAVEGLTIHPDCRNDPAC